MATPSTLETVRSKYQALSPLMSERLRRLWAASEALTVGRGGIRLLARATGLSRNTIAAGLHELGMAAERPTATSPERTRRPGGGRKRATQTDPTLWQALERLVDPLTRGDPQSPLRWTCKSTRRLAEQLTSQGHRITDRTVSKLLQAQGYSLQAPRKTQDGGRHPDRDAQFQYINAQVVAFQQREQPVISVDAKKKELVGDFKTGGREWQLRGSPEQVRVYDFPDKALGKAIPYGVYDVAANAGWVSVGMDHDTARFAVETLRRWWQKMGHVTYPQAQELLITADGGGSNGSRSRLWKVALQAFADETGLTISVCHFPPGTSKWNKIEHRMFCHLSSNWRGRPLESLEIIVNLIGETSTRTGLRIQAELDTNQYATGVAVSDQELAAVRLEKAAFHGEWNYTISPRLT
jgi:hypothetical protein